MKKIIQYYIGDVTNKEGDLYPVILHREENNRKRLLGWTMWVQNSFINRKDKTITNTESNNLEKRYKTTLFRTTKQAENFYKRILKSKGLKDWKRC